MVFVERRRTLQTFHEIPAEERVIGAPLIIDSADRRVIVRRGRIVVDDPAARIGRSRYFAGKDDSRFAVERRINTVIDEWRFQRNLPSAVAGR